MERNIAARSMPLVYRMQHLAATVMSEQPVPHDFDLDARGLNCPLPILRTKKALNTMTSGQVLKVLATDPGSVRDDSCPQADRQHAAGCQRGLGRVQFSAAQEMSNTSLKVPAGFLRSIISIVSLDRGLSDDRGCRDFGGTASG